MKKFRIAMATFALGVATVLTVPALQAQGPTKTVQASLVKEASTLSDKFAGLARVMAGKYDWKPGQGVRSAGDVFNLIVGENGTLKGTLTGASAGPRPAPITDPEKMQEALKSSYASLQQTITGLSDSDLKTPVKLFGMEMTKEEAIRFLFADQHEHLGQSIAYARTNGVVPPWSK